MKRYNRNTDDFEDMTPEEIEEAIANKGRRKQRAANLPTEGDKSEGQKGGNPLPQPIIYTDTVRDFIEQYEPTDFPEGAEIFDFGRMRDIFNAIVPFGLPDAMPKIIDTLQLNGFRLHQYLDMGPVIFARRRPEEIVTSDGEIIEYKGDDDYFISI